MQAYSDLLTQAQNTAATPYTPYSGEMVAPFNAQQNAGVAGINSYSDFAQPYIQQAAGMATNAAKPLTAAQIQQYESPYTQQVVDATQNQFNSQNATQMQGVKGNAIAQGALGGNREAIAEAETANQQQLAQAPVIAGLQNQGYQTGLNTALTQQQAQAAGAYSLGNLGVSGQNAGLTGATAQLSAGTAQQQTQQAKDAAAYQQFLTQQAYPFQTEQWLAGIDTGLGSQMGGTSSGTQTSPAPSQFGQIMGGISSGVGALGTSGAFGTAATATAPATAGWLAALPFFASGGSVKGANGVAPPEADTIPEPHETLVAQQHQLLDGHRRVQMFPRGTHELRLPHGMKRVVSDAGVFHYDPNRISAEQIKHLSAHGRENELLDLGPFAKHDVMARIYRGEMPVAVVERRRDGTEVRGALGTHLTAQHQMAMMHHTKSPGNTLHFEDPRHTLSHRMKRANGGFVQHFATGGGVAGLDMSGTPYAGAKGYVPGMNITRGQGAPHASAPGIANQPASDPAKMGAQIGAMAKAISSGNAAAPLPSVNMGGGQGIADAPSMEDFNAVGEGARFGGRIGHYASGGIANLPDHNRIMMPHGYADGGMPDIPFDPTAGGIAPSFDQFGDSAPTQFNVDPSVNAVARDILSGGAPLREPVLAKGDRGAVPPSAFDQGVAPSFADRALAGEAGQPPKSEFDASTFALSAPSLVDQGVSGASIPLEPLTSPGFGGARSAPVTGMEAVPLARATDIATPTAGYADNMDRIAAAHRQIESHGDYGAVGPANPKNGDRAYGAYQVMGANVPVWTKEYLGRSMTPQEFLHDKNAQDAVYKARMGQYIGQYGLNGALDHWLGMGKSDFTGTTHPEYQNRFMTALNGGAGGAGGPNGVAGDTAAIPPPENTGVAAPANGIDWSGNSKLWPALMAAGAGMMSSRSPFLGNAVGEGIQSGMGQYSAEKQQEMKQHQIDFEAKKLSQQADIQQKELALKTLPYQGVLTAQQQATLAESQQQHAVENMKPVQIGNGILGPIYGVRDPKSGQYRMIDPKTGQVGPVVQPDQSVVPGPQSQGAQPSQPNQPVQAAANPATVAPSADVPVSKVPTAFGTDDDAALPLRDILNSYEPPPGVHPEVLDDPNMTPGQRAKVKAIGDGRAAFLSIGRGNAQNQYLMDKAYEYNPNLDQTMFPRRQKTESFYAVGTAGGGGQNIVAINRWLAHSGSLLALAEKLNMGDYTTLNDIKLELAKRGIGSKETQDILGQWEVNAKGVAGEGAKVFAGVNPALADRSEWEKVLSPSTPLHTMKAKLQQAADMGEQALASNVANYNEGMRTNHNPREFLTPRSTQILDALKAGVPISSLTGSVDRGDKKPDTSAAAIPSTATAPSGGLLDEARATIAKGIPRDAVIQRLKDNGFDPTGL